MPDARDFGELQLQNSVDVGTYEHSLYERIRTSDHLAFETLFQRYYGSLVRFAYSYVQDLAASEDLVQSVFVRLWQNHARWEIKTSVKSYLYASVHYELLHTIRHERVQQAHVEDALANANLGIEPQHTDAGIMAETLEQAIEIAIAAMPERRRTAYLLRRQQEMSYAEIAVVMQITLKTVEHQIALALRDLRRALADWLE